jgi:hypothetical protein
MARATSGAWWLRALANPLLLERNQTLCQAALLPRGGIAVEQPPRRFTIEQLARVPEAGSGDGGVATGQCIAQSAQAALQDAAPRAVAGALPLILSNTFLGR